MSTRHDYLADVSKTDLMRVVTALATEVYALCDRLHALEEILSAQGVDLAALHQPVEPAVYDEARLARRDAFVERVFRAMADPG